MKQRHTKVATGVLLGLAIGLPAQGLAAAHESEMKQGGAEASASSSQQAGAEGRQMTSLAVDRLEDRTVVNLADEEIGEVEQVVRSKADGRISAVVSVGGFLGLGDKEVTIPLDELRIEGERLRSPLASTEAELKSRVAYDAAMYERVEGDRMVQLMTGGEPMSTTSGRTVMGETEPVSKSVGFGTLDVNRDGYLSKEEADKSARISGEWERADSNDDGRIDRSEFSAFEARESQGSGMQDPMGEAGRK